MAEVVFFHSALGRTPGDPVVAARLARPVLDLPVGR
jgi:hypothetical protein